MRDPEAIEAMDLIPQIKSSVNKKSSSDWIFAESKTALNQHFRTLIMPKSINLSKCLLLRWLAPSAL